MRRDVLLEGRLSRARLNSADRVKKQINGVVERLESWYLQVYETRNGVRSKISKLRRKAKAREIVDRIDAFDVVDDLKAHIEIMEKQE